MSKNILLAWTLVLSMNLTAQSLIGKKMPTFHELVWIQQSQSLTSFHPKYTVVEFWATWCSPCLSNLQHLNELSTSLNGKQVAFLSITDEEPERIKRFLQKRKINGWVACDTSKALFRSLNIQSLPRTLIMNNEGIICFDGRPEDLSAEMVLSAKPFMQSTPASANCPKTGSWGPGVDPAFTAQFSIEQGLFPHQQTIRKSVGINGSGYTFKEHFSGVTLLNQSLSDVIAFCYRLQSSKRVLNISALNDSLKWDYIFSENKHVTTEKMMEQIIQVTSETFNVKLLDTTVSMKVIVPNYTTKGTLLSKRDIDFSAPEVQTYKSLAEVYEILETRGNAIVFSLSFDSELYLDVFDIFNVYHSLTAAEMQKWLLTKGIRFEEAQKTIQLKQISSKQ